MAAAARKERTAFHFDEKCLWFSAGPAALVLPVGGWVQPMASGGHADSPEPKRRLKSLMDVSGLTAMLDRRATVPATREDLLRIHPASYVDAFKAMSDAGGGAIHPSAPFSGGAFEIALQSAGLAMSNRDGLRQASAALQGGGAATVFGRMVAALGGPADLVERPERHLPKAPVELAVAARQDGFVTAIATREVGLAVVGLGGGRTRPQDKVDHALGVTRLLPVGAQTRTGEPLALVHARSTADAERAAAAIAAAYAIGPSRPPASKAVIRRVLPRRSRCPRLLLV